MSLLISDRQTSKIFLFRGHLLYLSLGGSNAPCQIRHRLLVQSTIYFFFVLSTKSDIILAYFDEKFIIGELSSQLIFVIFPHIHILKASIFFLSAFVNIEVSAEHVSVVCSYTPSCFKCYLSFGPCSDYFQ